jgi:hypothetical protein
MGSAAQDFTVIFDNGVEGQRWSFNNCSRRAGESELASILTRSFICKTTNCATLPPRNVTQNVSTKVVNSSLQLLVIFLVTL